MPQAGMTFAEIEEQATLDDRAYDVWRQSQIDDEAERRRNENAMLDGLDRINEAVIALKAMEQWP